MLNIKNKYIQYLRASYMNVTYAIGVPYPSVLLAPSEIPTTTAGTTEIFHNTYEMHVH